MTNTDVHSVMMGHLKAALAEVGLDLERHIGTSVAVSYGPRDNDTKVATGTVVNASLRRVVGGVGGKLDYWLFIGTTCADLPLLEHRDGAWHHPSGGSDKRVIAVTFGST